jgi:hypothetical protein
VTNEYDGPGVEEVDDYDNDPLNDLVDAVGEADSLRASLQSARSAAGALVEALTRVIANDKTTYRHHEARPSDGLTPRQADGGTIFLTPKEIARSALESWRAAEKEGSNG